VIVGTTFALRNLNSATVTMARTTCCLSEAEPLSRGGALDALRFFASVFIVLYHFQPWSPWLWQSWRLGRGYLATDFFLFLSGFVLARVYGPRLDTNASNACTFLVRRLARVWPGHILILLAFALMVLAARVAGVEIRNPSAFQWQTWPAYALLIHSWGLGVAYSWNIPSWTLSALVVCYLLFPILWRSLKCLSSFWGVGLAAGLLAIADLLSTLAGKNFFALPPEVGVVKAVPIFLFGVAIARLSHLRQIRSRRAYILAFGAATCLFGVQMVGRFDLFSILLIALIVSVAGSHVPRRPSKLWAHAADVSFSLYITHDLVGMVWCRILPVTLIESKGMGVWWAGWGGSVLFSFLVAVGFHRFIDAPIQRWLRPRLDRALGMKPVASLVVHDHRALHPAAERLSAIASRSRNPHAFPKMRAGSRAAQNSVG
jgi:peptidoglycan/LPS O-acetylase OafA/YrhL